MQENPDKLSREVTNRLDEESSLTVLVISDEEKTNKSVQHLLQTRYNILTAKNFDIGYRLVDETISVVVLDIRTYSRSCFDVCDKIRVNYPMIPVVFFTAHPTGVPESTGSNHHMRFSSINKGGLVKLLKKISTLEILSTLIAKGASSVEI